MAMELEFRSTVEDAWYAISIVAEGDNSEKLRIKFTGLGDEHDEVYDARAFTCISYVEDFWLRFRPVSVQLQDSECSNMVEGMPVCATSGDSIFYDAVVTKVIHKEHAFVNGKEECRCDFVLFWRHGPNGGNYTTQALGDICVVQPRSTEEVDPDPLLDSFLRTAWSMIEGNESSHVPHQRAGDARRDDGGDQDEERTRYMVMIENLEKGISPFTVMEFIQHQLDISCQAAVWPSKSSEPYTRGIIVVQGRKNFDKLSHFLDGPVHMIISRNGRPWVTTEKKQLDETLRESISSSMLMSQTILQVEGTCSNKELKLVICGCRNYLIARRRKELFKQCAKEHCEIDQRLLHLVC